MMSQLVKLWIPIVGSLITGTSSLGVVSPTHIQTIHDSIHGVTPFLHHSTTVASAQSHAANLLDLYKQSLATHPLQTKMITGGTLAVAGDAIAQSRDKEEEYSKPRAFSFMAFDMCYRALQHFSFPIIVQQCQGQFIGAAIAAVPLFSSVVDHLGLDNPTYYYGAMEQTLASQLGIVPFLYYPVFYILTAFVQGLSAEGAVQRAKETFIPLMKRNLLFWIPVQFVQFGFIEESLQIPFLAVCGLAWTFIISLFAGNAKKSYAEASMDFKEIADDVIEIEKHFIDYVTKEAMVTKELIEEKEKVFMTKELIEEKEKVLR